MLRELAIFDYVSGDQTPSAKRNFERIMGNDSGLAADVQAERKLRAQMAEAGTDAAISMSNIDDLFARIDMAQDDRLESETQETDEVDQTEALSKPLISQTETPLSRKTPIDFMSRLVNRSLVGPMAAAASLAFVALLFVNNYVDSVQPNFTTLSDGAASQKVDFGTLVEQGRLAKFTVSRDLSAEEVSNMLVAYGLSTFESGAKNGELYVYSTAKISSSQTLAWRADSRVKEVTLFTTSE